MEGNGNGKNGNGVWKQVASVLIATLLTGAGTWLVFGRDVVTRSEMREAIATAPRDAGYLEDRKLIQDKLAGIERLSEDMAVIRDAVKELSGQMKMLSQQQAAKGHR